MSFNIESKRAKNSDESIEEDLEFKQLSHHEHVLEKPDSYIDSIENEIVNEYLYDPTNKKIIRKEYSINRALIQIITEIIENATDQTLKTKKCNEIKINVSKHKVSVYNNGTGIPIKLTKDKDGNEMYTIELLFGHLLTSEHYSKKQRFISIGTNGIGAKATNIFSTYFKIENVDTKNKKYKQIFTNNMFNKTEPKITDVDDTVSPYTKITFKPDFKRFGLTELSDDLINLLHKKTIDVSICCRNKVNVYFNDELITTKTLDDYIKLYFPELNSENIITANLKNDWKFGFVFTDNSEFTQISFINNANTLDGGQHVDYLANIIVKHLLSIIQKKIDYPVKPIDIKKHITLFVLAYVDVLHFNAQSKTKFNGKITSDIVDIPESILKQIEKSGIVENVVNFLKIKKAAELKKSDGKKTKNINIDKYVPALKAGGPLSRRCRLIITEGESAKSFAINGLNVIGHDYYGVYPIRGKMLNPDKASDERILNNAEIYDIKKIIGLKQNVIYTDKDIDELASEGVDTSKYVSIDTLNYGGILILADQDLDGYHIKGLIINFIHTFWRELCMIKGFFQTLQTPILKAIKGKEVKVFYNDKDYRDWCDSIGSQINKWKINYYKGLGTSSDEEAEECFEDFDTKVIDFVWDDTTNNTINESEIKELQESQEEEFNLTDSLSESSVSEKPKSNKLKRRNIINPTISDKAIMLAFAKDNVQQRKEWLNHYDKDDVFIPHEQIIYYSEFINKELKHFSNDNNNRSIPSIYDGLKPSQRKILYTMLSNKSNSMEKVVDIAGYVSTGTSYTHGNVSLEEAIFSMARDFTGSNNINLLTNKGNFGHRRAGGKDHAQARYPKTNLEYITKYIIRPEDDIILQYLIEEGKQVEPKNYYPIIPLSLVNGADGIGTGYSTYIPCFNPLDIIFNIRKLLDDEYDKMIELIPWYRGFTGDISKVNSNTFVSYGSYRLDVEQIQITELPINTWTDPYVIKMRKQIDKYDERNIDEIKKRKITKSTTKQKDKKNKKDKKKEEKPLKGFIKTCRNLSPNNSIDITFTLNKFSLRESYKNNNILKDFHLTSTIKTSNLLLYNENDTLTKYKTPNDILIAFYNNRLLKYRERQLKYLEILRNQLQILVYKQKYINDVINNVIVFDGKNKKIDIINRLIELKYPKLSTDINAIDSDEQDDIIDKDETTDKNNSGIKIKYKSYTYLTNIPIFSMTNEELVKLQKQVDNKKEEIYKYEHTSIKDLWRNELDELEKVYMKFIKDKENLDKKTLKRRKKIN